jgi:hypothetical protein
LQGDDVAAADSARGESCASADDERHADGNGANIAGTNQQQRTTDSRTNEHQTMEIGGNNQQEPISGTIQQNSENNE